MSKQDPKSEPIKQLKQTCGIIMPISGNDGYTADHWNDVKKILEEVIIDIDYEPNLVSDADEIGIIHNRIVNNIYNNPIVICDVSSKNPNVMFELGLRLAFDKATIIIKDNETNYNFDTAPIEHLTYPRDLRYSVINSFKAKLKSKLLSTIEASKDPNYSTFLKNFVQYKPKLETEEISSEKYILKQLEEISRELRFLSYQQPVLNPFESIISLERAAATNINTYILNIESTHYKTVSEYLAKIILGVTYYLQENSVKITLSCTESLFKQILAYLASTHIQYKYEIKP